MSDGLAKTSNNRRFARGCWMDEKQCLGVAYFGTMSYSGEDIGYDDLTFEMTSPQDAGDYVVFMRGLKDFLNHYNIKHQLAESFNSNIVIKTFNRSHYGLLVFNYHDRMVTTN